MKLTTIKGDITMVISKTSRKIFAAEELDPELLEDIEEDEPSEDLDELEQDADIEQDDPLINIDNNIEGKYIAECDRCGGVFISALSVSDVPVDSIHGICPLCDHDTDQYLKWYVASSDDLIKKGKNQ